VGREHEESCDAPPLVRGHGGRCVVEPQHELRVTRVSERIEAERVKRFAFGVRELI
jgi:hypothetical protein